MDSIEENRQSFDSLVNSERDSSCLFSYVSQREDWDCGVACVAMALKVPYLQARALVRASNKGLSSQTMARLLGSSKLITPDKLSSFKHIKKNLVLCVSESKNVWGHYVVKDANNNIYDPDDLILSFDEFDYYPVVKFYFEIK